MSDDPFNIRAGPALELEAADQRLPGGELHAITRQDIGFSLFFAEQVAHRAAEGPAGYDFADHRLRVFVSTVRSPRHRSGGSAAAPLRGRRHRKRAGGRPVGSGCSARASARRPGAVPRGRFGAGSARDDRLAGILREGQIAGLCLALHPEVFRFAHAETYCPGAQGRRALPRASALGFRYLHGVGVLAVEQMNGSCFAQRVSSDWSDVPCPESAASLASGG